MLVPGLPNGTQTTVAEFDHVSSVRQATLLVWRVGVPLVIVLGTFGNIMILLIQRREYSASHSSMSVFFTCLAISDLTSLWFDPFFWWLEAFDVYLYIDVLCKVRMFATYLTGHMSASILATMTVQKAVSILWPHKVKVVFTARFAKTLMSSVFAFFLLLNSHLLYGITFYEPTGNTTVKCFYVYVNTDYADFFNNVWGWMDTFFCSFAPVTLLVVSNSVLIWKVGQSLQEARRRFSAGNTDQLRAREKKTSSMTLALIATSIAFLLLTSPVSVYFVFKEKLMQGAGDDQSIQDANDLAFAALHLLWIGNNAVTFYIYCLTGAKFRENFFNIIYRKTAKERIVEKSPNTVDQCQQSDRQGDYSLF